MKYHSSFILVFIAVLASCAFAQNPNPFLGNVSEACSTAAEQLANDPFKQCLPVALISDVSNASVALKPLVKTLCGAPECDTQALGKAVQEIYAACANDTPSALFKMFGNFLLLYKPLRDSLCFMNKDGEYCSLKEPNPLGYFGLGEYPANNVTKEEFCTECSKVIGITMFNATKNLPQEAQGELNITENESRVESLCGGDFLKGEIPEGYSIGNGSGIDDNNNNPTDGGNDGGNGGGNDGGNGGEKGDSSDSSGVSSIFSTILLIALLAVTALVFV